jgi:hypothetical protein
MLYIFGRKVARIAKYTDKEHICYPCKAFEREVSVYMPYFHLCFIPVFPIGKKQFEVRCTNCGDDTKSENLVRKYEQRAKTPLYLFSALILAAGITAYWIYWNSNNQKNRAEYVANPKVGDVYTISEPRNDGTAYYFLRVAGTRGDTVMAIHSSLEYNYFVNYMVGDDHFVKNDTSLYERRVLKTMLENGEIYMVRRNYDKGSGFNQIR